MKLDYYYEIKPLLQNINESGDLVFINETADHYRFGLIDGLGHGAEANSAASKALKYLNDNQFDDPALCLLQLHEELQKSRGAVIALFLISKKSGEAVYSGIGNITSKLLTSDEMKFLPRDGIVGYNIPSPKTQSYNIKSGDVLVMYSDGLKDHFDLLDHPGMLLESAENITKILMSNYAKNNDDVSLLTIKAIS